jgi:hypothetical protein
MAFRWILDDEQLSRTTPLGGFNVSLFGFAPGEQCVEDDDSAPLLYFQQSTDVFMTSARNSVPQSCPILCGYFPYIKIQFSTKALATVFASLFCNGTAMMNLDSSHCIVRIYENRPASVVMLPTISMKTLFMASVAVVVTTNVVFAPKPYLFRWHASHFLTNS